jgi:hypothetical protein
MNIYDLIFMACLSLNQGAQCKQQMLDCVLQTRDADLKLFLKKTHFRTLTPDRFLTTQPQADWTTWTLNCAQKQGLYLNEIQPLPRPSVGPSNTKGNKK